MTVPNFTHINKKLDPADTPEGFSTNDNTFDEATSVFFGGQIYCNFGAFSQGTYERPGSSWFLDNTDIRYANKFKLGETDVVYGVTANNNPTVQDPWNTTPAWSFPFVAASDALAPTPSAGTMIEGAFAGRVAGTGVYIFANDKFYLEGAAYGTFDTKTLEALGLAPDDNTGRFSGLAPYWRAAYEQDWDKYSVMFGTFGMFANVAPIGNQSAPTNEITDVGGDAQLQYIGEVHALTARIAYIFEHQKLNGSQPLGLSSNSSDGLNSFKVSGSYVYNGTVSLTAGYFNVWGDADPSLYGDSLSPMHLGSPNSNGWIFDVAWIPWSNGGPSIYPWFNARISACRTRYTINSMVRARITMVLSVMPAITTRRFSTLGWHSDAGPKVKIGGSSGDPAIILSGFGLIHGTGNAHGLWAHRAYPAPRLPGSSSRQPPSQDTIL